MNTTLSKNNKHAGTRRVASKGASAERRVLVCDLSGSHADLARSVEAGGWKVDNADSTAAAEKYLYSNEYHVGLVLLPPRIK